MTRRVHKPQLPGKAPTTFYRRVGGIAWHRGEDGAYRFADNGCRYLVDKLDRGQPYKLYSAAATGGVHCEVKGASAVAEHTLRDALRAASRVIRRERDARAPLPPSPEVVYPELEKLANFDHLGKIRPLIEFLDWLVETEGAYLRRPESHEHLVARYYGIDMDKVEKERRRLLAAQQKLITKKA